MKIRKTIVGNWKMNKTVGEAVDFIQGLVDLLGPKFNDAEVILCPPFTALYACTGALGGRSALSIGAQNVHPEPSGAYTGEISAPMLRDLFCRYVIVGHWERRLHFGETGKFIHDKIQACFSSKLRPILCLGETLEERQAGRTHEVLAWHLREALGDIDEDNLSEVLIAYEPIWAIGAPQPASPEEANEAHVMIRRTLAEMKSPALAEKMRILYGGGLKPESSGELLKQPEVDGLLVGSASLEIRSFYAIIQSSIL